jgi:hypothetical protein
MGILDQINDAGTVRPRQPNPPGVAAAGVEKNVYITKETLTFPGVTAAAGIITGLVSGEDPELWVSAIIGGVIGLFLTVLSIMKASQAAKDAAGFMLESIGVGVLNTALLIAAIHGVGTAIG